MGPDPFFSPEKREVDSGSIPGYDRIMIQGLLDPVRDILETLCTVSGKGIRAVRKPDLKSLAHLRMAGPGSQEHVLFHRGGDDPLVNHVIANECGHLIRLLAAPPGMRMVAVANERTRSIYRAEIGEDIQRLSLIHGIGELGGFLPLWYEGVVFQLTRMPPDIGVERWLHREYPALREIQRTALMEQQAKAAEVLSRGIRRMTPRKVYDASQTMNYAFFRLMEPLTGLRLTAPYERSLYVLQGGELAALAERNLRDDHEGDVTLTRRWAESLALSGWIEWRELDEVEGGTLH